MIFTIVERARLAMRNLWPRVAAISFLSVFAVLGAKLIAPILPDGVERLVGAGSVDNLLDIMAGSMLAVTTFSLSVMVSVHRSISSQWTPRAHRVQLQDKSTQMVLATFVGAFIYALLSIILRATDFFVGKDVVVLFATTLLVNLLVVVMILRWILRLQSMGSLPDIAGRISDLTAEALTERARCTALGAVPLTGDVILPGGSIAVHAATTGRVERVFVEALQSEAKACKGYVYLMPQIGDFVAKGALVAHVTDERLVTCVLQNLSIGHMRDIEQDPVFGMQMLAEIAPKALSPGINDAGTAVDILDRMTGLLLDYAPDADAPRFDRLFLPPLDPATLVDGPFGLIARDGESSREVSETLRSRLEALADHREPALADAARDLRATVAAD